VVWAEATEDTRRKARVKTRFMEISFRSTGPKNLERTKAASL
jgi:hypothetical protein